MKKTIPLVLCLFIFSPSFAKLPDLIPYRKGDLWGYCDSTKRIIIPCQFYEAGLFDYIDSARGKNSDGQPGYIMKNGDFHADPPPVTYANGQLYNLQFTNWYPQIYFTLLQPAGYDSCDYYYPIANDSTGLYGFTDCRNRLVIPCRYAQVNSFSEDLASVQDVEGYWFFIDKKGRPVIRFDRCQGLGNFSKGLATVSMQSGNGLINKKGEFVILPVFYSVEVYENLIVCSQGDYGLFLFFDKKGNWLMNKSFSEITQGDDGSFMLVNEAQYSFINKNGKPVPGPYYREAKVFSQGLAAVSDSNSYWGFINSAGKMVIPSNYSEAFSFSSGLAAVCDSTTGSWGFIDQKGVLRIPLRYSRPENEYGMDYHGLCKMQYEGYLDYRGTEYWEE